MNHKKELLRALWVEHPSIDRKQEVGSPEPNHKDRQTLNPAPSPTLNPNSCEC